MSLLPFLVVTGVGAVAALLLRSDERVATGVGLVALLAAVVTALGIQPGQALVVEGAGIATTEYLRLFLVLGVARRACCSRSSARSRARVVMRRQ